MPTVVSTPTSVCNTPDEPLRFLALGDSYTIGESVAPNERWPNQLVTQLRSEGLAMQDEEIVARTGWTTAELAEGISAATPQGPYNLVTLLIGVNNQYRGLSQDAYRDEFVTLLKTAVIFADNDPTRVIVLSIPDWGATPFAARRDRDAIAADIDAFNAINRAESAAAGVSYINITPISRRALTDASLTAADFLHPSGKMYAEWVQQIKPAAISILAADCSH
ncbi:MAG: SGNH/GDSL hydrolase family protein [Anaerolineales bacterium]|nr:SGNH/GDSL hydrolase family protein [Anaerolineales bacterium]